MAKDDMMAAASVAVDDGGRVHVRFADAAGKRYTLDLTALINDIADAKIAAHLRALHGHQM